MRRYSLAPCPRFKCSIPLIIGGNPASTNLKKLAVCDLKSYYSLVFGAFDLCKSSLVVYCTIFIVICFAK